MAMLVVCAIYDSKVGAYGPCFCAKAKGEAVRNFMDACKDENLPFHKHPGDFVLFVVGAYDDSLGCVSAAKLERLIGADEV